MDGADNSDDVTKEIKAQLQDFDDCWNHVAKRTLEEKEKVRNILVQCYPWTTITDSGDTTEQLVWKFQRGTSVCVNWVRF